MPAYHSVYVCVFIFYLSAYNRKIKTFLHCGDLLDGDFTKIRPDQNYQLFRRGFDEQTMYAVEMYPYIEGARTFFIEGSHDQTHVKNGGATPGLWISKLRDDMIYLGTPEAVIELGNVKIKMQHPGGGCARSLSYKPQIAIDEMDSNDKPNIFLQGHFHKSYGGVYRNVHFWLVPSFMNQSGFMKLNNLKSILTISVKILGLQMRYTKIFYWLSNLILVNSYKAKCCSYSIPLF